ncbi:MAG: hypothetical protein ACFB0B_01300 [Thermonemataceae bacterium]
MPANKKYLSTPKQRTLKTSAGILGGFMVTILLHNALGTLLENKAVLIITSAFSSFVVWASLLLVAFLFRNGWKVWGLYLLLSGVFLTIIFLY